jgi:hypothetical protein
MSYPVRLLVLGLLVGLPASAQSNYPRGEIFGGYSYLRGDLSIPAGWNASVAGNLHRHLGVEADFSGHYGGTQATFAPQFRHDYSSHFFLVGPKFAARLPKLTPWAHALFGVSRLSVKGRNFVGDYNDSGTAFAWAFGGGIDVRLLGHLSARVIQADYIRAKNSFSVYTGSTGTTFYVYPIASNNLRLSFGVVLRLGG